MRGAVPPLSYSSSWSGASLSTGTTLSFILEVRSVIRVETGSISLRLKMFSY